MRDLWDSTVKIKCDRGQIDYQDTHESDYLIILIVAIYMLRKNMTKIYVA